jgi:Bacterial alpha-L-rhamnosidase 6 hairpin glycosidase domain
MSIKFFCILCSTRWMSWRETLFFVFGFILFILHDPASLFAQDRLVDFRFAPQNYLTAICLPDDWQKTLVTETGALAYDLGPGPYAKALTEVTVGVKEKNLRVVRQYFADPRVPIAITEYADEGVSLTVSAFVLVPEKTAPSTNTFLNGKVQRIGGLNGCIGWATPAGTVDPAFRNVAWGTNRPIKYRVKIAPGSRKQVALGVIEPYKPNPGMRDLELRVEGATAQHVDPLQDRKNNRPYVYWFQAKDENQDGWLSIESHTPVDGIDPNTTLSVFWVFPENMQLDTETIISGALSKQAEVYWDCGRETELQSAIPRRDVLHAKFDGADFTPIIRLKSRRTFRFDHNTGVLITDERPFLVANPKPISASQQGNEWILELPPGTKEASIVVQTGPGQNLAVPDLRAEMKKAQEFWLQRSAIPFDKIIVPDSSMQYLLDANIRNFYQIHELIDGVPQFQPGPSVYRGLWIHDAIWHNSAALMLGDTANARRAIDGLLRYQQPDGQVKVMAPFPMNRETVCFVYILCRYARMTGDKAWLERHWWRITQGLEWLRKLREQTLADPNSVAYGLFPPGFADGGLGGLNLEYGSVYWSLIGVRAAAEAAQWLGKPAEATKWKKFYDEILASFRNAAKRDARQDRQGNWYLPMKVADTSKTTPPQQANWGIVEAQGFGQLFALDDSLVVGTLKMLQSEKQEGLPINTGWLKDGVWPFFGSLQAIAHIHQRNYLQATDLLYAIANHASPLGTWVEEQLPKEVGTRTTGDQSNASASALFIKLVRRMLVLERGKTLELLAGVPDEWFKPGARIELNDVPTLFGRLTFRLKISTDGKSCRVHLDPVGNPKDEGGPVLFLSALKRVGYRAVGETLKLSWGRKVELTFERK